MTDFRFHMTRVSSNKKVGPIPVTTSSENTCPTTCPLFASGCYAKSGPLALHWRKVSDSEEKRSLSESEFLDLVKSIPKKSLWRHNQAGDLPHTSGKINGDFVSKLIKANRNKNGFTYTHHDLNDNDNLRMVQDCNIEGFTVNHSADTIGQAVAAYKRFSNVPVVTLLPMNAPNVQHSEGVKVVACPAEKSDKTTCASCGLCAIADRDYIIGFRVHGTQKKKAELIAVG